MQAIYDTEWPIRLEYVWDGGWTWSLIGHNGLPEDRKFPRVWFDDQLAGENTPVCISAEAAAQMESLPVQERDWLARGYAKSIEEAASQLADVLSRQAPDSDFAKRWRTGEWCSSSETVTDVAANERPRCFVVLPESETERLDLRSFVNCTNILLDAHDSDGARLTLLETDRGTMEVGLTTVQ